MAFWVALSDADGNRVADSMVQLFPAPKRVLYPEDVAGTLRETSDGVQVLQQPSADGRVRAWIWDGYPGGGMLPQYERQWQFLTSLRARLRRESGLSPYIYVRETSTGLLVGTTSTVYTLSSSGHDENVVLVSGGAFTPGELVGATLEVLPVASGGSGTGAYQTRAVIGNTANTITVSPNWQVIPTSARIRLTVSTAGWYRARVLGAQRVLSSEGGKPRYETSTFRFTIDDATFQAVG